MIKYFVLLFIISSYSIISSAQPQKRLCSTGECGKERNACSCYCSVKCGPREIKPEDTPKYDEQDGQCFCAPRDKALYRKNSCHIKEAQKNKASQ